MVAVHHQRGHGDLPVGERCGRDRRPRQALPDEAVALGGLEVEGIERLCAELLGGATIVISAVVLVGWIPLRQRPGLGTVANLIVIGIALDVMAHVLPHPHQLGWRLVQAALGIATVGLGSAFYLTANLGPGPRDGWMTGIHRKTGVSIAAVRTMIEVVVLAIGFALGGDAGIATFAFAVLVGYALASFFRLFVAVTARPPVGSSVSEQRA